MIILCCPIRLPDGTIKLWDSTRESLEKYAPQAQILPFPAEDVSYPWRFYTSAWGDEDLVVIEQDITIHEDVVPQFENCPEPWCLFPFRHYAGGGSYMRTGIGCNRFRKEFQQAVSISDIEAIGGSCPRCNWGLNRKCWAHLDGRTREAGEAKGFSIHVHWPTVGHRESVPGEYEGDE